MRSLDAFGKDADIGDDGFEHRGDQRIAALLRSGNGARKAAQKRQMRGNGCGQTHDVTSPSNDVSDSSTVYRRRQRGVQTQGSEKSSNVAEPICRRSAFGATTGNQRRVAASRSAATAAERLRDYKGERSDMTKKDDRAAGADAGAEHGSGDPLGANSEIGRKLKQYYDELVVRRRAGSVRPPAQPAGTGRTRTRKKD